MIKIIATLVVLAGLGAIAAPWLVVLLVVAL